MSQSESFSLSDYLSEDFSQTLFDKCVNQLTSITDICFMLCGLFALVYIANILMKTWAKGEPIDFHSLVRPFIIGVVVSNFSLVYSAVDGVFSVVNQYTEVVANVDSEELTNNKQQLENLKSKYVDKGKEQEESTGFWRNLFSIDSAKSFFDNLYVNCMDLLLQGLQYIAGIAFGAVKLTIRAVSLAFRIVLVVFGPIAFALSLLPMFKDNWKNWLSKYINVCMFIPIANLMDVIINQLHNTMIEQNIHVYESALQKMATDASSVDSSITTVTVSYVIFLVAFIVLYLMIPSIASYIVSSSGMESLTGGITLAGSAAASKLISGTAQNPLTPNILRFFKRWRYGKETVCEVQNVAGQPASAEIVAN